MPQISADTPLPGEVPGYISGITGQAPDGLVIVPAAAPIRATLIPGTLIRGAVLGLISGTGQYALCDRSQSDGRQTPAAILASPADPARGRFAMIYAGSGYTFDPAYLFWHSSWTLAAIADALRPLGIACMGRMGGPV